MENKKIGIKNVVLVHGGSSTVLAGEGFTPSSASAATKSPSFRTRRRRSPTTSQRPSARSRRWMDPPYSSGTRTVTS